MDDFRGNQGIDMASWSLFAIQPKTCLPIYTEIPATFAGFRTSAEPVDQSTFWRTKNRNRLSFVSPKNLEVSAVNGNDGMFWE
jgi:hypothetical protein